MQWRGRTLRALYRLPGRPQALGDIRDVIQSADPASKARIYNQLELRLTYQAGENRVHAQANLNPSGRGGMGSVRGGT